MPLKWSSPCLSLLVCTAALSLSGCVAVPLAQLAVSQMATARPACAPGPACQTDVASNSFGDISAGMTNSFHRLMGNTPEPQTVAVVAPPR
jgi:hypothetical protein